VNSRSQNKRRFESWSPADSGGRIYRRTILGKRGWSAIYYKEVDLEETTLRFWQEIFDSNGILREIHAKFPVDTGHRKV
jgi:hypothetical protein